MKRAQPIGNRLGAFGNIPNKNSLSSNFEQVIHEEYKESSSIADSFSGSFSVLSKSKNNEVNILG